MMEFGGVNISSTSSNSTDGKRQRMCATADGDDEATLRTYVFPFCWPETLSEHQKHFEQFSRLSDDRQILRLHWLTKVILLIAKPVDSVLVYVNRLIWTSCNANLPIKSLSFDEKELFWKFAYVKLGRRVLCPQIGVHRKQGNKNSTAKIRKSKNSLETNTKNAEENSHSTDIELFNRIEQELQHLRKAIQEILGERIKKSSISSVMQLIESLC